MSARQGAALLGVKLETLYAYASRGLVTSIRGERGRPRRYLRDDLLRLKARHDARAGHGAVAAGALRWGEPVLDSRLTAIGPDGPRYRGLSAVELARGDVPFEAVAELLWTGAPPEGRPRWAATSLGAPPVRLVPLIAADGAPLAPVQLLLAALSARVPAPGANAAEVVVSEARSILPRMAAALALPRGAAAARTALAAGSVAQIVAAALGAPGADSVRLVERALVVSADHELNASSFAARLAASVGADVRACLLAASATLTGSRHGGTTAQVEALVDEVRRPGLAAAALRRRSARGEEIPGFGHPLYRSGDPRAPLLLEAAFAIAPREPRVRTLRAIIDAASGLGLGAPTLDVGLVALASALRLRTGAPLCLFAAGRAAGWVAHAIEQYEAGFMLRPRARYVGPS